MPRIHPLFSMLPAFGLLACASASWADPPAQPTAAGDFRFQKVVAAGTKVEVHDMSGAIFFEPASGDTLEVVATKRGRSADLGRVQIVSREEGGTLLFCALWPGQDPSSCRPGGPRGGNSDDLDVNVEFRVRLPAKVTGVTAVTLNGAVRAHDVHGSATLRTLNGLIDVDATGEIVAETANGAVEARARAGQSVRLHTTNGAVTLALPASAGADVEAATTNGRISSDFGEVPAPSLPAMHSAQFKIGAGGTPVSLHTTNGGIRVRRM